MERPDLEKCMQGCWKLNVEREMELAMADCIDPMVHG